MRVVLEITAMQIDGVGNVLDEAPIKLANCVLLFCKGLIVARWLYLDFKIVCVWPFGLLDYGSATLRCKI